MQNAHYSAAQPRVRWVYCCAEQRWVWRVYYLETQMAHAPYRYAYQCAALSSYQACVSLLFRAANC